MEQQPWLSFFFLVVKKKQSFVVEGKKKNPLFKIDFVICHALNCVKLSLICEAKILPFMKQLKQMINEMEVVGSEDMAQSPS